MNVHERFWLYVFQLLARGDIKERYDGDRFPELVHLLTCTAADDEDKALIAELSEAISQYPRTILTKRGRRHTSVSPTHNSHTHRNI